MDKALEQLADEDNREVAQKSHELQYRAIPTNLVRRLTREDCKKGFCDFSLSASEGLTDYFKCKTCGRTEQYSKMDTGASKRMAKIDKLSVLQPKGRTLKDFIYYYGEPKA